jgi:anti-sigma B factor antagonist
MTINVSTQDTTCVLRLEGELDALSAYDLRPTIGRIDRDRPSRLLVDLSGLRMIDSSGVGALVCLFKTVRSYDGKMAVWGASEQPLAIFRLLNLDRVLMPRDAPT